MKKVQPGHGEPSQASGGVATQTRFDIEGVDESQFQVRIRVNGFRCANGHVTSRSRGIWLVVDEDALSFECPTCGSDYVVAPVRSAEGE